MIVACRPTFWLAIVAGAILSTSAVMLDIRTDERLFTTSDGGEAGLMFDSGFIFTPAFANATFLKRLKDLSKGGGQVIRLGGGPQCCIVYNVTGEMTELPMDFHSVSKYCHNRLRVLNATWWNTILDAVEAANVSIVFGINSGVGRPWGEPGPWDPSPSGLPSLLDYTMKRRGKVAAWELGNEPYKIKFGYNIPGEVLAADCATLRKAAHAAAARHNVPPPMIACPDYECTVEPGRDSKKELDAFFRGVDKFVVPATTGPDAVDALTLHWYGIASRNPNVSSLALLPSRLDKFGVVFKRFPAAAAPDWHGEVWAGETAEVQQGGKEGVSNAFSSSFWLYDQLGQQGEVGVARMLRTCLACANYNILDDETYSPNPDFFTTVLWRQVVGPGVLEVSSPVHTNSTLRVYGRCSRHQPGWVAAIVLNLGTEPVSIAVPKGAGSDAIQRVFLLTAGDALKEHSKLVALNGKVLAISADGKVPDMEPSISTQGSQVALSALSIAIVEYDAAAPACADPGANTAVSVVQV